MWPFLAEPESRQHYSSSTVQYTSLPPQWPCLDPAAAGVSTVVCAPSCRLCGAPPIRGGLFSGWAIRRQMYVYSNLVSRYLGKYAVKRQDQSRGMAFNLGERTRTCTHGIVHAEQKNGTNQNLVVGLVWERRGFLVDDFEKRSLLSSSIYLARRSRLLAM